MDAFCISPEMGNSVNIHTIRNKKMNLFILLGVVGPWQAVIIVVAILLLFGGKKIPELMKGLGQGMKEFKKASSDLKSELNSQDEYDESKKEIGK